MHKVFKIPSITKLKQSTHIWSFHQGLNKNKQQLMKINNSFSLQIHLFSVNCTDNQRLCGSSDEGKRGCRSPSIPVRPPESTATTSTTRRRRRWRRFQRRSLFPHSSLREPANLGSQFWFSSLSHSSSPFSWRVSFHVVSKISKQTIINREILRNCVKKGDKNTKGDLSSFSI